MGGAVGFGGASQIVGWSSSGNIRSEGIGLPVGKSMANGSQAALIVWLSGWVAGHTANRAGRLVLGAAATAAFTTAAGSGARDTGPIGCGNWLVQGGAAQFSLQFANGVYFGRGGGGSTTDGSTTFAGTIGGAYGWADGPSAPPLNSVRQVLGSNGTIHVSFNGSSDNGGAGVRAYLVEYSDSLNFSTNYGAFETGSGEQDISGLKPGKTWYVRVSSRNAVTDAAGTTGQYSATGSVFLASGGRVWDTSAFKPVTMRAFNGTALVPATARVWDGATGTFKPAV